MSLEDLDAALSGGGAKSAFNKETPVGTTVTGTITDVSVQQITDYVTKKPKFWDGDRPQNQIVIILQTNQYDDSEDDGRRAIYIKTWGIWKENLMNAVQAAGYSTASDALKIGNTFTDTFTGTKPSSQGSDTKVHTYRITATQTNLEDALGETVNTSTGELTPAPVTQAPVAAAAPVAAPDPVATAHQLIALNIPANIIATQTGLPDVVISALIAAAKAA